MRLRGVVVGLGLAAIVGAGAFALFVGTSVRAFVAPNAIVPEAQPVLGPPEGTTLIGSTPGEAAGETWAYALEGGFHILRYTEASGTWQPQPSPLDTFGAPLSGFTPAPGPLAGAVTPNGGVAIVGEDATKAGQVLLRNPGGAFQQAPTLSPETSPARPNALLEPGETLTSGREGVLMTAIEEPGARTGLLIVPFESSGHAQESVLAYNGGAWTREPICAGVDVEPCQPPAAGFRVLAIGASSPSNAWLLARTGSSADGIVLFSRDTSESTPRWRQRSLGTGALGGAFAQANPTVKEATVRVSALENGQPLTVTSQGVWVDGTLTVTPTGQLRQSYSFTLFYAPAASGSGGEVLASWCDPPAAVAAMCSHPLGSQLPSGPYRSFAWAGGGPEGERVITGLEDGISLSLHGEAFTRVLGSGGESGTQAGAAFSSPEDGWLANHEGGPLTHLTTHPEPDLLQSWPVPFRRPLDAIATQPGSTPGDPGAQAIAVGVDGQIARYTPGQGWAPEALLSSSTGEAQTEHDLRGVAWPEPGRAYAVGTNGAMWLWRADTGLWEPDPARPPNLFLANFTGIAFDPTDPARGYVIGQQGVLRGYGKTWEQEPLPPGLDEADFTSIAFAGSEALVTYQIPRIDPNEGFRGFEGGLLVNDGGGWQVDSDPALQGQVPVRVAGLPDGGAAVALADGGVLVRQGAGAPWTPTPAGPVSGYPVALAAFREGSVVRPVVSIDHISGASVSAEESGSGVDRALEQTPPSGQAPVHTAPYPLPASGFLLRETSTGWEDEEHRDYPSPDTGASLPTGENGVDWPEEPDAVLALALGPDDGQGWAVGGQSGELNQRQPLDDREPIETAGVMRYPANGAVPAGFSAAPEQAGAGNATFAIGGGAQCATACANLAEDQLGPDSWLANAIHQASQTSGVQAFLYTGEHLAPGLSTALDGADFQREETRYAQLLSESASSLNVFAAPSASDLDPSGTLATFASAMGGHATGAQTLPGTGAYAFEQGGVRVIVLDYSHPVLDYTSGEQQQCWLAQQLAAASNAQAPAIVVGQRSLTSEEPGNVAADAAQVVSILAGTPPANCVTGLQAGAKAVASAYFYDAPQANRVFHLEAGGVSVPAYGSGTLGYITPPETGVTDFLGASGFLLAEVETVRRVQATDVAPVHVRLIPDISELALDATGGVLLRRSQPSLFTGLARRPHAGLLCERASAACNFKPDPYVPIPSVCTGSPCASGVFPEYTFTSSNPDIGQFVEADPTSPEGTTVLQEASGRAIPDEPRTAQGELTANGRFEESPKGELLNERREVVPHAESGLFCAYNAGTTTVTVHAGGLSSSQTITVQPGSVEQPCGTVPLRHPPAPAQQEGLPVPLPAPATAPAATPTETLPPPPSPPVAAVPVPAQPAQPHPAVLPTVPLAPVQLFPILPLLPPPAPNPARPTPPSGTAEVSQTVGVEEYEREEEGAIQMVHHMAAYEHRPGEAPLPTWPLGLVLVAALAGAGLRGARPQLARVGMSNSRRSHDPRPSKNTLV